MIRMHATQRPRRNRSNPLGFRVEALEDRALMSATPLLIQMVDGSASGTIATMAAGAGVALEPSSIPNLLVARGGASGLRSLESIVESRGLVQYVERESQFHVEAVPNDPDYQSGLLWGLSGANGIQASTAWNTTTGSAEVVVADVDTGVDYKHPDLYLNIWLNQDEIPASRRVNLIDLDDDGLITFRDLNDSRNQGPGRINDLDGDGRITGGDVIKPMGKTAGGTDNGAGGWSDGVSQDGNAYVDDLIGWNYVTNTNDPMDDHGHGTHTSGTVAAVGDNNLGVVGVNWKSLIMPLKFLDSRGNGSDLAAAVAVRYAADSGARVSSNSYAGGGGGLTFSNAISYAGTKGHLFVAAAGNSGSNNDVTPNYPSNYTLDNVVAVAAIDSNGKLAGFSSYGATSVDLAAPGVSIRSTTRGGGYGTMSGTSMATPHVAGAAALVLSAHPSWTASQVKDALLNNTTPLASLAGKTVTGGTLNVGKALAASTPPPQVTQVFVSGTSWTGAYKAAAGDATYGYPMPTGSAQNLTLPWANLNRISIRFSQPINPGTLTGALVAGLVNASGSSTFPNPLALAGYDEATRTATYALPSNATNARYDFTLKDSVKDVSGNALDGEWTNKVTSSPSGNGVAGGAFDYSIRVLPGDIDRSNWVNIFDVITVNNLQYTSVGQTKYRPLNDVDGNGWINIFDVITINNLQFTTVVA